MTVVIDGMIQFSRVMLPSHKQSSIKFQIDNDSTTRERTFAVTIFCVLTKSNRIRPTWPRLPPPPGGLPRTGGFRRGRGLPKGAGSIGGRLHPTRSATPSLLYRKTLLDSTLKEHCCNVQDGVATVFYHGAVIAIAGGAVK